MSNRSRSYVTEKILHENALGVKYELYEGKKKGYWEIKWTFSVRVLYRFRHILNVRYT